MANPHESALDYPLQDRTPAPGTTLELAPGVHWVRMPLPFALDHVNVWLLRDRIDGRDGWTVVDCGIADAATRSAWEQVFSTHLQGLPVLRVIVTHMHPDHVGLAHWLTGRWTCDGHECRLWMSATDWNAAQLASRSTTGVGGDAAADFFAGHGLRDAPALAMVRARSDYYGRLVPQVPASFHRLMDGPEIVIGDAMWRCIAGYGHAPEHISLHCAAAGVLISGDMVLPRISTNVSVSALEPEGDPLPLYLRSLERLRQLPADTLVLPSHGKPFRGLPQRIDQLRLHHAERLQDVLSACSLSPRCAAELLPVLFKRPLDLHQTTFAMGEAIAHLRALWYEGRLLRRVDGDGVYRFAVPA